MTIEPSKTNPKPLSEMECDRKAMLFWCGAGKPEGQYPVYRKAVERWNEGGAVDGAFDQYLKLLRKESMWARLPQSVAWPWITALVIPVLAVGVVLVEIQANRMALLNTFQVQREQNRQQVLNDYIAQMTNLITEKDLVNKYPKDESGEYDPNGKQHPDAIAASSLTKTVVKLLKKENDKIALPLINQERGGLIVFLYESKLIQHKKTVINLSGADLRGADLHRADLSGANLSGADLNRADLRTADLSEADLRGTHLSEADLRRAVLIRADLSRAILVDTDLRRANLSEASLIRAYLNWAILVDTDLRGASLSETDLSEADLRGANLIGTDLMGANLSEANLEKAILIGKDWKGKEVKTDFQSAIGLTETQKADLKARGAIAP